MTVIQNFEILGKYLFLRYWENPRAVTRRINMEEIEKERKRKSMSRCTATPTNSNAQTENFYSPGVSTDDEEVN